MPIAKERSFLFENSNGIRYRVLFNVTTGVGSARKITGVNSRGDGPSVNGGGVTITPVAVTIDSGARATAGTCHVSRLMHAAIYNTTQTLNTILNAAS
jgi:hypothetical protein